MPDLRVDHADVLDTLYDAALQPELMPQALNVYARALNGSVGLALDPSNRAAGLLVSPDGEEGSRAYAKGWWKHDVATQRANERRLQGPIANVYLTTAEERASDPFYQEFCQEYECFWGCSYAVRRPGAAPLVIGVRRPERAGPFLLEEAEQLAKLGQHAARAIDIAAKLANAANRATALADALTRLGYGVIGLNCSGKVVFVNPVVEGLCGHGLRISHGAMLAGTSQGQRSIDLLIAETLALAENARAAPPRPVALARPGGRAPAVLLGMPVSPRHGDVLALLGGRPQALIVVIEPDAARRLDEKLLQEMFDLSPGEARVAAAIATGATVKGAAMAFGISEGTLRVLLKRVFQKVGVSRQAELVLLLAPLMQRN